MAEHFGKEMLCPVGNATAKSFEFFSSILIVKALHRDWTGTCIVFTNAIPGLSFCFCRGTIKLNMHYRRAFRRLSTIDRFNAYNVYLSHNGYYV